MRVCVKKCVCVGGGGVFESQYVIDDIVEVFGKGEIRLAMDLTQRDF